MSSVTSQIPQHMLFRYRLDCPQIDQKWAKMLELPKTSALPNFWTMGRGEPYGEIRTAWSQDGFYVWLKVKNKRQSVWSRATQILDSDGIQIWLDTRDTHNVHRATKYCHWIFLSPAGNGAKKDQPIATMLKINRAKEDSPSINRVPIKISSEIRKTGYTISAFIPSGCINGWNPDEHRELGFNYSIVDRELGYQPLAIGPELPVAEDPSLWSTIQLLA